MKISEKQMEAILKLSGPERYKHFVKLIVDWEAVWGLYQNGWALAATSEEKTVFPVWPAEEYAALCAKDEWEEYEPSSIDLNDFIEELLPNLKNDGVLVGVFYTPNDKGITPDIDQIVNDINKELEKY